MSNRKNTDKDVTGIVFDTQTRTVLTSLPRGKQNKIKEKISSVREVVPHKSNNEITLVLEHFDYNVEDTIAAFLEGGAANILQEWNCRGSNKTNKKIKKKGEMKPAPQSNGIVAKPAKNKPQLNNIRKTESPSFELPLNGSLNVLVDAKLHNNDIGEKDLLEKSETHLTHSNSTVSDSLSDVSSRQNSVSDRRDFRPNAGKKNLEKPINDLNRHSVSLQRVRNLLAEEFTKSEKRLKQSFQELHKILQDREMELAKGLKEVKEQANNLLEGRITQANKLKFNSGRIDSMNGVELNELRIDLKHFISERKFDEDLGRTVRFMRDHDRLMNEIRGYGEVIPAKNLYTGRRISVSSTPSGPAVDASNPNSTVVTNAPLVSVAAAQKPVASSTMVDNTLGCSMLSSSSSPDMSAAELSELRQKLQKSLMSQGLSVDATSSRFNGVTTFNSSRDNKRTVNQPNYRPNRNFKRPGADVNGKLPPKNKTSQ